MKRSRLSRKSSRLRKLAKSPLAQAKKKLWKVLKQVIDIRDGDTCISCGATGLRGHNKHGGHFIPSSSCGGFLRYDLRNVWVQCATCNLFRNGAGAEYTLELQKRLGQNFVEKIVADKQVQIQLDVPYIEELTKYYGTLLTKSKEGLLELTKNYNGFKKPNSVPTSSEVDTDSAVADVRGKKRVKRRTTRPKNT
jgi:hypothetical protein